MKRKQLIAVSIFSICLFASACGSNTTDTEAIAVVQNTETQQAEIETENNSTELVEESLSKPTEQIEVTEPTTETSKIPESKGWTDYKKTIEYYKEQGLMSDKAAYVLNPDIYGTETAGKSAVEVASGNSASVDAAVETREMKVTTTKGYKVEAVYYVEAGTVQFIYTGEVNPGGGWYTDPDSLDVLDAAFNYEKSALDITHEQKIQILGEPTMTAEEVIAALQ